MLLSILQAIYVWVLCVQATPPSDMAEAIPPTDMIQLAPNSANSEIYFRWQPILQHSRVFGHDCVSYPAIDIHGRLAEAYISYTAFDLDYDCPISKGQTYSRLWQTMASNQQQQGLVYTWFFPRSFHAKRVWLTSVWWMETEGEALLGCSFYGFSIYRPLPNGRYEGWKHYSADVCMLKTNVDEWGTSRYVITKERYELRPASLEAPTLRGTPTILVFDYMPARLKRILKKEDFGNDWAKFPFSDQEWAKMPTLYREFNDFLLSG